MFLITISVIKRKQKRYSFDKGFLSLKIIVKINFFPIILIYSLSQKITSLIKYNE